MINNYKRAFCTCFLERIETIHLKASRCVFLSTVMLKFRFILNVFFMNLK